MYKNIVNLSIPEILGGRGFYIMQGFYIMNFLLKYILCVPSFSPVSVYISSCVHIPPKSPSNIGLAKNHKLFPKLK